MSDYLDDWDDDLDGAYEDVPLYKPDTLAAMDEAGLQREWERQCNIHDSGVDRLPMGHPTIEDAAGRMRLIEAEQTQRGLPIGPSPSFYAD